MDASLQGGISLSLSLSVVVFPLEGLGCSLFRCAISDSCLTVWRGSLGCLRGNSRSRSILPLVLRGVREVPTKLGGGAAPPGCWVGPAWLGQKPAEPAAQHPTKEPDGRSPRARDTTPTLQTSKSSLWEDKQSQAAARVHVAHST